MIIDNLVDVKIGTKNIKHFINLNYFCKIGDIIIVKPIELLTGSNSCVNVECDICGNKKIIKYRTYIKNIKKYPIYCCSSSCSKMKEKETKKERYGDNYEEKRVLKMKETNNIRYGNENTSQIFRNEKNTQVFLNELKKLYGDMFDYSKVNYINNYTELDLICKKHGIFKRKPNVLLIGKSCKLCDIETRKQQKININIEKANNIHKNKYDYSLIKTSNVTEKVEIICPIHGVFKQDLHNHILGKGCLKCSHIYNKKDWLTLYAEKHNNKYDYTLVNYINSKIKIDIICQIHGMFKQLPSTHLSGVGCPYCANKSRRLNRIKTISENKFDGYQVIPSFNKIGCEIFNNMCKERNVHIQHAMNGGEYFIKELGYWIDGYDIENNIVYEYDEKRHYDKNGELNQKDKIREKEISDLLKCKFIRIKE
jgi:hypothetical protein